MNKEMTVRRTLELAAVRLKKALDGMRLEGDAFHYAAAAEHDVKEAIAELDKPDEPTVTGMNKDIVREAVQQTIDMCMDHFKVNKWRHPMDCPFCAKQYAALAELDKPDEPTVLERLEATLEACHIVHHRLDLEKLRTGEYWVFLHVGAATFRGIGRTLTEAIEAALKAVK
jgi:hypothetical protein